MPLKARLKTLLLDIGQHCCTTMFACLAGAECFDENNLLIDKVVGYRTLSTWDAKQVNMFGTNKSI
jgi:hypothetical protein